MTALRQLEFENEINEPSVGAKGLAFVNHLRLLALKCRAAARTDLFEACAVLSSDDKLARQACAEALVRCFFEAVGKRPILHRPGSDELSFDESWLARLADVLDREDEDSFQFLISSRVPLHARRSLAHLVRMSTSFSEHAL